MGMVQPPLIFAGVGEAAIAGQSYFCSGSIRGERLSDDRDSTMDLVPETFVSASTCSMTAATAMSRNVAPLRTTSGMNQANPKGLLEGPCLEF